MKNNIQNVIDIINPVMNGKKDVGDCQLITLSSGVMKNIPVWATGIPSLDIALGVGGIPKGRIVEIYGPESSGKTTLALNIIGRIQGKGGACGFIDAEHALDPAWAKKCGVDIDNLLFCQPDCVWEGEYIWTKEGAYKLGEYDKDNILSIKDNINWSGTISNRINSEKECYKVTTSRGSILCSMEHRFKTFDGYKKLSELNVGDAIENVNGNYELTKNIDGLKFSYKDAIMAGMLIADGCYNGTTIGYTKLDDEKNIRWINEYLEKRFPNIKLSQKSSKQYRFVNKTRSNKKNMFTVYFQALLGIVKGRDKRLPKEVFAKSKLMSGLILGLFSCDSHIQGNRQLTYSTVSKNVIENVKLILSYFNIDYKYGERWNSENTKEIYSLSLNSRESIENFIKCVGKLITSYDNKNISKIDLTKKESFLKFPVEIWDVIWEETKNKGYSKVTLCRMLEPTKKRYCLNDKRMVSLKQMQKINSVLHSEKLKDYIHNDIVYSKITSIKKIGYRKCVDLQVPRYNNFICNGFHLHNCGEDALCLAEEMIGQVDAIVIDSVSALVPRAEINGEIGDAHVGLQARLMGQALRKMVAKAKKKGTDIIFINQIRYKIGVMFGCLHGNTLVNFINGDSIPIKEVVENKIEGEVWSYNELKNKFEPAKILDWKINGRIENKSDMIHFKTHSVDGGGRFGFAVTKHHEILSEDGWKLAKNITLDDSLLTKYYSKLNSSFGEFIYGMTCGDIHILIRSTNTACIKISDNENIEYMEWKVKKLSKYIQFIKRDKNPKKIAYFSSYSYEFAELSRRVGSRNPLIMLEEHYSDMGLAIWFMDDANYDNNGRTRYRLSVKRFKNTLTLIKISVWFSERGYAHNCCKLTGDLLFTNEASLLIAKRIHTYIPVCMQYKLPEQYQNMYKEFELHSNTEILTTYVKVLEMRELSEKQFRAKGKVRYDLTIDKNENYSVGGKHNGIIVHNSPETTSGGNALKFYATIRLDIRRTGSGKATSSKDSEIINNTIKIKVAKNKVAPPFKIATPVLDFEHGFDLPANLLPCLIDTGVIKKTGNTYKYEDGDVLGVGINQAVKGFREMFSAEDMETLYENYLVDKLSPPEEPKKKKKKKKKDKKKKGKK